MDDSQDNYAAWKKPDQKKYKYFMIPIVLILEKANKSKVKNVNQWFPGEGKDRL